MIYLSDVFLENIVELVQLGFIIGLFAVFVYYIFKGRM